MRILNIGSMNLDLVYKVDHIVRPGETEASASLETFLGGKGMNQSVALAKAGAEVWQAGMIGEDGQPFLAACREYGIHSEHIRSISGKSRMGRNRVRSVKKRPAGIRIATSREIPMGSALGRGMKNRSPHRQP